jgi:hypothetical protein
MYSPIAFGSDPETFVAHSDGVISAPFELIPAPKEIVLKGEHGGYNRDGMALELNPEASSNPKEVVGHMLQLLTDGSSLLKQFGLTITNKIGMDIANLPDHVRNILPSDCFELGCDPDYSAYTRRVNRVRVDPKKYTKRFAGGHISVQIERGVPFEEVCELVKLFDRHAGLYSLRWSVRESLERRKTYGKAGAFRWKPEDGIVEYRTPDAGWLWNDGYEAMCSLLTKAYHEWRIGIRLRKHQTIVRAINECDKTTAQQILQ